jgi:Transposase DDE domain
LENLKQATSLLNEPERCVHIGDREGDIYELFCVAQEAKTHFLVRTCVDRLAEDGTRTIAQEMREAPLNGLHLIKVSNQQGHCSEATLEIRWRRIRVLPPIGKQKRYPELTLTVIYAQERGTPKDRKAIDWKLLTNLPVGSRADAIQKLAWYASRWKVETYHKILKSGCKAEESRLRTADRLVNLLAVFCILSWRLFWMTMLDRSDSGMSAGHVFSKTERQLLDHLVPDRPVDRAVKRPLSFYITKLARLGGYLARADDPPPGYKLMWRGLSRLTDIELGFNAAKFVGN